MKKLIFKAYIFSTICIFSLSCHKYEEGPAFSLVSAKKRLEGTYELEKQLVNDKEIPVLYPEITSYKKDGTGERTMTIFLENPEKRDFIWEFDKKREKLRDKEKGLDDEWGDWTPYKKILRLTKDELWLLESTSQEKFEYHYKKIN